MSIKFFYKDGQGEILDESGAEAMDWEEGGDPFNIETLMTLTQYQKTRIMYDLDPADPRLDTLMEDVEKNAAAKCKESARKYNVYSNDQKSLFLYCLRMKLMSAVASARHAGIAERTAQKWAKRLKEDLEWDIYAKETNKVNRNPS